MARFGQCSHGLKYSEGPLSDRLQINKVRKKTVRLLKFPCLEILSKNELKLVQMMTVEK